MIKIINHPSKQNIKIAVDNCIFTVIGRELYILLIQMKKKPFAGKWALPGGLVGGKETLSHAASRILESQTAVKNIYSEQLFTFDRPDRDPRGRVVSIAYFALVPFQNMVLKTSPKYSGVKWQKFSDLPKLAYDHSEIALYAKQRLEWKMGYSNVAWSLLPDKFTLTELREIYEAILEKKLDKKNFNKKIMSLGLLEKTKDVVARGAHRPAALYRFKSKKYKIVEVL